MDNDIIPIELQKAIVFGVGTIITMAFAFGVITIAGGMVKQVDKMNL